LKDLSSFYFGKFKTFFGIKTVKKILLRTLLAIILLLLISAFLLVLPPVQTKLGSYTTDYLNEEFGTDLTIEKVKITVFGNVKLNNVVSLDKNKKTLFKIKNLNLPK